MLAITAIIGVLILAAAAVLFFKSIKGTAVTVLTVAAVLLGLFLIFGVPAIFDDSVNTVKGLATKVPGTGSATYTGEALEITSFELDETSVLSIEVKNIGATTLNLFKAYAGDTEIGVAAYDLAPDEIFVLRTNYKPTAGGSITVISSSASDTKAFN